MNVKSDRIAFTTQHFETIIQSNGELKIDDAPTQRRDVNIYEQGKAFWNLITVITVSSLF